MNIKCISYSYTKIMNIYIARDKIFNKKYKNEYNIFSSYRDNTIVFLLKIADLRGRQNLNVIN